MSRPDESNTFICRRWPVRAYNLLGGLLKRLGVPLGRLTEESLLATARRWTGLSDFGDEGFREPFRVLLKALEEEAELTPFGRLLVRVSMLNLLSNRLRVHHEIEDHPEILQTPVGGGGQWRVESGEWGVGSGEGSGARGSRHSPPSTLPTPHSPLPTLYSPLFIAGLPRTGTTLLYNLLAQDPESRPLLMWEAISPAPRANERGKVPDPRIRRAAYAARVLARLAPGLPAVHPLTPEGPEECSRLLMNTFVTVYAVMENHVPSYRDWFLSLPDEALEAAYQDYYRQLQVLQYQRPPRGRWLLKSPAHLFALKALMKVFPHAGIIQIHRDPAKVVPSLASLFAVYQGMASDRVRPRQLGPEVLALCKEGLRRGQQARECAPSGRILDLKYHELVRDPIGTVRRVYGHFGYRLTDEVTGRMRRWHEENPKNKHGKHQYDLEPFGLDRETICRAFGPYCRHYGIEPENPSDTTPDSPGEGATDGEGIVTLHGSGYDEKERSKRRS